MNEFFKHYYSMFNKYVKQWINEDIVELDVSDETLLNKAIAKRNKEIEETNKNEN